MTRRGTWTPVGRLSGPTVTKGADVNEAATCDACNGTGWEQVPGKDRTVRKCQACDYWDRARGTAPGIPESEREAVLANYEPTGFNADALKHAKMFVDGVHHGIYLHGPVGTGKTRLACSILNEIWKARTGRVRFIRVPELMVRLTPAHSSEADADGLIGELANVPILVLDDIGANAGTDFSRRMIQVLFDAREDRGHRTVFTSNLTVDELGEFLSDERLPSRITGSCRIVELKGPDQRSLHKPKPATKPAPSKPATKPGQPKLGGSRW